MLQTICYVSSLNDNLVTDSLEELFNAIEKNNIRLNISGILIYKNGNFLQILEGDAQNVNRMYTKIRVDSWHHEMIQIVNTPVNDRLFENYDTGFGIVNNRKKISQLKFYLNWLKKAELKNVDKLIKVIENFIHPKALQTV